MSKEKRKRKKRNLYLKIMRDSHNSAGEFIDAYTKY